MSTDITIERATPDDAYEVAVMVGELLEEIMRAIDKRAFNFYLAETTARLEDFLIRDQYFVYLARAGIGRPAGFIALDECYALYAEGAFGTIPELYVRPEFRGQGLGRRLVASAREFGVERGWTRLEVTTPPLPQFDRTLTFYQRDGFAITGGRKLKVEL